MDNCKTEKSAPLRELHLMSWIWQQDYTIANECIACVKYGSHLWMAQLSRQPVETKAKQRGLAGGYKNVFQRARKSPNDGLRICTVGIAQS